MKEFIDLYAKLVIGTFSFIGPSFTLLISLFYEAIEKSTTKHQEQIINLALTSSNNDKLKKQIAENEKEIRHLDPKVQVRRLFGGLLAALSLIGFYYFQFSHFWQYNYVWIRVVTLCVSLLTFCFSLFVLWQIFCTIIQAKSDFEKEAIETKKDKLKKSKPSLSNE